MNGKTLGYITPKTAIKAGIGLITEDRRGSGIFPLLDITTNTTVSSLGRYLNKIGLLRHGDLRGEAER